METGTATAVSGEVDPSHLATVSNVMLADTMGDIERRIAGFEAQRDAARAEMTRRRLNAIEGARFIVVKAIGATSRFDAKAVRQEMGSAWYEARQKPGQRTTYTVIEKPANTTGPAGAAIREAAEALFRAPRS